MSAYIVELITVQRVTTCFMKTPEAFFLNKTPQQVGKILYKENVRSVDYRYDEKNSTPKYNHEDIEESFLQYYQSAQCLGYQSCETPDYNDSLASKILDAVFRYCIEQENKELINKAFDNMSNRTENLIWG